LSQYLIVIGLDLEEKTEEEDFITA